MKNPDIRITDNRDEYKLKLKEWFWKNSMKDMHANCRCSTVIKYTFGNEST